MPKVTKFLHNHVDFIRDVICFAHCNAFFEDETCCVALVDHDYAGGGKVMAAIGKLHVPHAHRGMVETEAKKLQTAVHLRHIIDVEVDGMCRATRHHLIQLSLEEVDLWRDAGGKPTGRLGNIDCCSTGHHHLGGLLYELHLLDMIEPGVLILIGAWRILDGRWRMQLQINWNKLLIAVQA